MTPAEVLQVVFWHAVGLFVGIGLFTYAVTCIADARHPDHWHKEKVATESGSWKLVDVGSASETEKDDWVIAIKGLTWITVIVAAGSGLLWLGGRL